jgi:hypothetical protein
MLTCFTVHGHVDLSFHRIAFIRTLLKRDAIHATTEPRGNVIHGSKRVDERKVTYGRDNTHPAADAGGAPVA